MIKVFEANYPESLGVILIHKSPWIFQGTSPAHVPCGVTLTSLGIWTIIKGWLDPVVASKVHFTKSVEELEKYIERSHIIKELGGDDQWTYEYVEPRPDENERMEDSTTRDRLLDERAAIVKDFERLTQEWIQEPRGIEQKRTELAGRLRSGYWQLDPYIRARSLYDRTKVIQEGGRIQHYDAPRAGVTTTTTAQNGPLPAQHRHDDLD